MSKRKTRAELLEGVGELQGLLGLALALATTKAQAKWLGEAIELCWKLRD